MTTGVSVLEVVDKHLHGLVSEGAQRRTKDPLGRSPRKAIMVIQGWLSLAWLCDRKIQCGGYAFVNLCRQPFHRIRLVWYIHRRTPHQRMPSRCQKGAKSAEAWSHLQNLPLTVGTTFDLGRSLSRPTKCPLLFANPALGLHIVFRLERANTIFQFA